MKGSAAATALSILLRIVATAAGIAVLPLLVFSLWSENEIPPIMLLGPLAPPLLAPWWPGLTVGRRWTLWAASSAASFLVTELALEGPLWLQPVSGGSLDERIGELSLLLWFVGPLLCIGLTALLLWRFGRPKTVSSPAQLLPGQPATSVDPRFRPGI